MISKALVWNGRDWRIGSWPLILLVGFISIYIPAVAVVGYRWTVELSLAFFLIVLQIIYLSLNPRRGFVALPRIEFFLILVPLTLFSIWSGLSILWALSPRIALHHTLLWACYLTFYLLIRSSSQSPYSTFSTLKIAGIVIFAISAGGVIEFIGSNKPVTYAFTSRYYSYAEVIVTFLPIFTISAIRDHSRKSYLWILNIAVCWLLVVLTGSRIMFVAGISAMIVLAILCWFTYRQSVFSWKGLVLVVILVSLTLLPQLPQFQGESITLNSRLSGQEEHSALSARSRFLLWGMAVEGFRMEPFHGIGADNYYSAYGLLRENLSLRDPGNLVLEINEDLIPERAHNEYVQILCELGVVGGSLFGLLLLGVGYMFVLALRNRTPRLALGAFSGISAFLIASAASSYSFRFPANGLCFFFLLAVATHEIFGKPKSGMTVRVSSNLVRWALAFGITVSLVMVAFSVVRALSIRHLANAQNAPDNATAESEIKKAIAVDGDEPMFRYYYGQRLYLAGRFDEAISQLGLAIENGLATSPAYFDRLAAMRNSGQKEAALATFEEALRVYPRSVFLRTAFASFLKQNGDATRAENEFQFALSVNEKQARSWQLAHDEGLERLVQVARIDNRYLSPFDLKPDSAPLAVANFQRMEKLNR